MKNELDSLHHARTLCLSSSEYQASRRNASGAFRSFKGHSVFSSPPDTRGKWSCTYNIYI